MRISICIFLLILVIQRTAAQEYKYLVHLKDKNNSGFSLSNPSAFLSEKSIQRRSKQHIAIDSTDLPINRSYVDSIATLPDVRVLNKSKWFNQVLISISDTNTIQQFLSFSFVISTEPVNNRNVLKKENRVSVNQQSMMPNTSSIASGNRTGTASQDAYNYGNSLSQIHIHHGEYLHNLGFHGEGMTIAVLDDGFKNYLDNPAFDSVRMDHRILGTYDYVNGKTSVSEEDQHGANCFSIIASNVPGTLIGTAPAASFWLFKTEDVFSESPVEEQNWIAAAEFADSAGVDLITTSLGYDYFDDPVYDIHYPERNGHSSIITLAANRAVSKGIIVTASQGNSGGETSEKKYVICPADGDSVFAVGAVDINNQIAGFSSWGPNASGQIKPDGVSVGLGTFVMGPDGTPHAGNGTSYANPNLAGLITCLWQAFPEFVLHDILSAVRQSSNMFSSPDDRFGFGLPDFEKAYQILAGKRLEGFNQILGDDWIRAFPVPFHQGFQIILRPAVTGLASVQLLDVTGKIIKKQTVSITANQLQLVEFTSTSTMATGAYYIRYMDTNHSKTIQLLKN